MPRNTRNRRRGRGRGRNPNALTESLTPRRARRIAKSEARAEYGPTIRNERSEARGSRRFQRQIGQWYGRLGADMNQAAEATDRSYDQASAAVQAALRAGGQAEREGNAQTAESEADFAKLVGADPRAFEQSRKEAEAAAAQRQLTGGILATPLAAAGASQAAYMRNLGVNARREGISQRGKERERRLKIRQNLTALRKERSQKTLSNFQRLRTEERDYGIQRAAFNLDKRTAGQEARENAEDRALDRQKAAETARHNRVTEGNEGKGGGLTPSQRATRKAHWNNAKASARTLFEKRKWKSWAELTAAVERRSEVPPAMARRAVERIRKRVEREGFDPGRDSVPAGR